MNRTELPLQTDWVKYKHGVWRKVGHLMELFSSRHMLPCGFRPAENAIVVVLAEHPYKYRITVRIQGW